jgi:hypothetical protein
MKVSELIAIRPALEKLASKEYDLTVALKFAEFTRKVLEKIQDFENLRADLFIKYGEKQEDGNLKIAKKNEKKFKEEIEKALNKNVRITPLTVKGLKMQAAPADLVNCLKIFK